MTKALYPSPDALARRPELAVLAVLDTALCSTGSALLATHPDDDLDVRCGPYLPKSAADWAGAILHGTLTLQWAIRGYWEARGLTLPPLGYDLDLAAIQPKLWDGDELPF
ncbi:MAG: hypothetical protein FJZ01_23420 [Candidatus Sericytochromatia bacterium]|nr:hypothetical protein [Candidatus Tanganyikabacteria bacterium]